MSVAAAIPIPVRPPAAAFDDPLEAPNLAAAFLLQAQLRSDLPALYSRGQHGWKPITWSEYRDTVLRLSSLLVGHGVGARDRVAIWAGNRPEWLIASAAVLCVGACTAPIYTTLSDEQIEYVLGHSGAVLAVVEDRAMLDRLTGMRDRLPALREVVVMEGLAGATPPGGLGIPWETALALGDADLGAQETAIRARIDALQLDDVATLIYTSGTTGPPKGVMATHRNLLAAMRTLGPLLDCGAGDRVVSYLPLAHVLERLNSEIRQYGFGNAVWFVPRLADLPQALREVRPTFFVGVPRVWEKMADSIRGHIGEAPRVRRMAVRAAMSVAARAQRGEPADRRPGALTRLGARLADRLVLVRIREQLGLDAATVMISGAAPIAVDVLHFYATLGMPICEGYGMTENMATCTVNPRDAIRYGTVGPPVPGTDIAIAEDGEILTRGESTFAGYYRDEAATSATITGGWLRTGDIGHLDEAGYLRITDRKKDLIITAGGKNIAPTLIETMLTDHPLVADAVVIGDRRPYIVALLTIDRTRAVAIDAAARAEVDRHVSAVNERLSNVEKVRRYALLDGDFHIGEELTPTYKVRRPFVVSRYADVIEGLYGSRGTTAP